jgi:RIP metalloprotease RseP
MWWIVGVLAFVVIILLSIVLHEAGHFLTAKLFNMKATEFFVGFGKRLWSFRRGETEDGVKAIPAGGYVRIIGMSEVEEIAPEDRPRAFYRQKAWQRLIVLASGSAMHFVIAFVILLGLGLFADQHRGLAVRDRRQLQRVRAQRPAVPGRAGRPAGRRPGRVDQRCAGHQLA